MIFHGRNLDVLGLWGEFVDLPSNIKEPLPTFLDKVVCPNPEHDTHKRHFQINTKQPIVHCFARCGISGTYEHAVAMILGVDEKEARRIILKHTKAALGRDVASVYTGRGTRKTVQPDDPVAKDERALRGGAFHWLPQEARDYLDRRGIDAASRGKWEIGWSEDEERLVIPAYDQRGAFRFLIKRSLRQSGSLKYLYTQGAVKSSILFGACYLDRELVRSSGLVLVEGSIDTILMHQHDFKFTVGTLGSGLSRKQVRLIDWLQPRRGYLFFDKDSAGIDNIKDANEKLGKFPLFVCRFPKNRSDPAEMTRREVERALTRSLPIHEFYRTARKTRLTKEVSVG